MIPWHTVTADEATRLLRTDPAAGLSSGEAARRLAEAGPNELPSTVAIPAWKILLRQFKSILIVILLVAIGLSLALGHVLETAGIAVITLFTVVLGFVQEYRADRSIEALRRMAAPTATVIRDGEEREAPAREVVPGDIVLLCTGDLVPADCRLLEAANLQANESSLTGESAAAEKSDENLDGEGIALGERRNMVYSSTVVTYGRGRAVVAATGPRTEVGKIGGLLETVAAPRTPLERQTDALGKTLVRASLAIVAVVVALGVLRGQPLMEILVFGIAFAVAVVPEALPAVVTISLAIGARLMAKRNALIRRLPTVETLGCATVICSDKTGTLTTGEMTVRENILVRAREMADRALRVLAVSGRQGASLENAEKEMTFLGLFGMIDPPRPEAREAIETCNQAGIRPVMITGDHPATARAIALELGLLRGGRVVTGADLDAMSDESLEKDIESFDVYARVSPEHKLRVVSTLQKLGHVVAMTGDGVNDAPALKKADIGVAMGITGTDVAKEAAAMTLTDDNFASIVAAVREGRAIFDNIKKYLMYLLSSNIGEIGLIAATMVAGLPLPLTTDGLPALALAVDPHEPDLMRRRPRKPGTGILSRNVVGLMLLGGTWSMIANLGVFVWALRSGLGAAEAATMTFVSLVLIQFFKAYIFRSERHSLFRRPFANRWLNLAVAWELLLLAAIVYVPVLQKLFGTFALSPADWLVILPAALSIFPVLETAKWARRMGWIGADPA